MCIFACAGKLGPLNDLWCLDYNSATVSSRQWAKITTAGAKVEARYRMATTQYEESGVTYFVVFGGQTAAERRNDLYQ